MRGGLPRERRLLASWVLRGGALGFVAVGAVLIGGRLAARVANQRGNVAISLGVGAGAVGLVGGVVKIGYQIDPRTFLNQLAQAEGALQRDLAALAGSRRDLKRYEALATARSRS